MTAFLASVAFVVLAEMGDKTQLLAMAFATRFRASTVLWAVLFATALNHLLAVAVGSCLTAVIPLQYVRLAAAISFVGFGLWTIRGDELADEEKKDRFGPFWTVAIAFFLAEMGDKTQLATVALAAKYETIVPVWLGTTTGMMIADAIGIVVGIVLGKKIPERTVKWIAAAVFILFGLAGLAEFLPKGAAAVPAAVGGALLTALLVYLVARKSRGSAPGGPSNVEPEPAARA